MFWLIWQMALFLLIAFVGGIFVGWQVWGGQGRDSDLSDALDDTARLRQENENLARRLGEAEARTPLADIDTTAEPEGEASKAGAAAMPAASAAHKETPADADEPKVEAKPVKTAASGAPKAEPAQPIMAPMAEVHEETEVESDDLTKIKGLGPKAAAALKSGGITRIAQIAAWSDKDVEDWDARINGRGRIVRDAWVSQAKALS